MSFEVFYINLDRVPHRREFMSLELQKIKLGKVNRFPAVDAKVPGSLSEARFRSGISDRWALPKSAIACFESHRAVWQMIVDKGLDAALILEDDVVLSHELTAILSKLNASPQKIDVVKMDFTDGNVCLGPVSDINGVQVRTLSKCAPSAGAYFVTKSGVERLLSESEVYGDTVDDFIFAPRKNWKIYHLVPARAMQLVFNGVDSGGGQDRIIRR
ncbi:glycosyltransferase family 25 protein [Sulfitobacter sp. M22]|uniref:glycosyltransferase family 25 protein n=1 Tax=Sulfitobacter sp. M22 TaxID=2675332 RepID=UPI001F398CCF|nr:glycosyltransferase family 25 protein [Sulfitobacter sp. M22]